MTYFLSKRSTLALALLLGVNTAGCDILSLDDSPDPNGPSLSGVLENATRDQIANLAAGIEGEARVDLNLYLEDVGVVGREFYRFSGSDPRFVTELLGYRNETLDNNTFYISRPWAERYRVIRNAHIMLEAVEQSVQLDAAEKAAARGYARTWIAYQLLLNLNLTHDNGVRVDVADFENLGPIVSPAPNALAEIARILDEGAADLAGGGGLPFPTTIAVPFDEFNRALAARVAIYRGQWQQALDLLPETFVDAGGSLERGAYHLFSSAGGDLANLMYYPANAPGSEIIVAHPSFVDGAAEGDTRAESKVTLHLDAATGEPSPVTYPDTELTSDYTFFRYPSPDADIPIIRNAELLLIRAEANIRLGNADAAVSDLDVIRTAAGLGPYTGDRSEPALIDELLYQRNYELYGEGHRWIDMRRYDRLGTLPTQGGPDAYDVWTQFPLPFAENV